MYIFNVLLDEMNSKFSLNKSRQIPDIVVSSEQSVVVIIAEGNFQLEETHF